MREKSVEDALKSEARRRGVWAIKSERLVPGFPDRLLLAPGGRFALVELKRPGGTLGPAQRLVRRYLRRLGFIVHIIDHTADVQEFFQRWLD